MSESPILTIEQILSTLFFMGNEKKARVLEAAESAFVRFGYRRTTMGDLAGRRGHVPAGPLPGLLQQGGRSSRPSSAAFTARTLEEIRQGLDARPTPLEKLRFAFDLWAARPFGFFEASPERREPLHGGLTFAKEAIDQAIANFEAELAGSLGPERHGAREGAAPRADRPCPHPRRPRLQGIRQGTPRSSAP